MDSRQEKGLLIANTCKIEETRLGWKVPSQSGNGNYIVNLDHGEPFCSCSDFESTGQKCKHIYAVEFMLQNGEHPENAIVAKSIRTTYIQDWPAYNEAQTHEQEWFVCLLHDLCSGIEQPPQTFGRPKLLLSDTAFTVAYKVYSTMSGRRFMPDCREAAADGFVTKPPSFTSIFRYIENPELTPLLKTLIGQSASPLSVVETEFAVDSSGFTTTTYARWFDHKYGKKRTRQTWVKIHLICGVKTHTVTSVEVTPYESADNLQFPSMVEKTAKTFTINEVSADKAYSDRRNLHAAQAQGGIAYIPFKSNSTGMGDHHHKFDALWNRMWHFYNFNRGDFLQHYHKRSNVETAISMIKAKFGSSIRAKTPTAQVNEMLCKVLCHNICVLIQSIYELGLAPNFCTFGTKEPVVPKMAWEYDF